MGRHSEEIGQPAPHKPAAWTPAENERDHVKNKEWMSTKTVVELEDLADDPDLYDDRFFEEYRNPNCEILGQCLEDLAAKYSGTKFVKIVSTDCIKDYPDFNLPTLLIYNNTNVKATLVGLQHYGGRRCTPEDVAFKFVSIGPVLMGPNDDDREAVTERVRRDFLEKIVSKLEQKDADSDDD